MSEVRLTTAKTLWVTSSSQILNVVYQIQGQGLMGSIEFTGDNPDGPWTDVNAGPWFAGSPSPFQVVLGGQALGMQIAEPPLGTYHFRVKVGPGGYISNAVKVTIKRMSTGQVPD